MSLFHPAIKGEAQQVRFIKEASHEACSSSSTTTITNQARIMDSRQQTNQQNQEENMAPKLVHKQYNSPIDLYSMNNIRRTIEAHTEMIAPGIKGINFMKADAPVNKQSEVYKLVMEEEQRARQGSPRLSPISGQPISTPAALADQTRNLQGPARNSQLASSSTEENQYHKFEQHYQNQPKQQQSSSRTQCQEAHDSCGNSPATKAGSPTCCECGQFIVGPYAKIQNRCVHPQCFNCTTCGTSLKNTGYFTVNEKLYCDIHAKQVAKVMQIQYDFGVKQNQSQQQFENQTQLRQQQQNESILRRRQEEHVSSTSEFRSQFCGTTPPATISTMFANRTNSEANDDRREAQSTWRPVATLERLVAPASSGSSIRLASSYQQQQNQGTSSQQSSISSTIQIPHQQQQQTLGAMGTRRRGLLQEGPSLASDRIPICVHCQHQIKGPYILAGTTTWCKQCSQVYFNCSSCRKSLLDIGFIEDNSHKYYCETCFEAYYAPTCSKCNIRIKGDCLNALGKHWHPSCFVCGHCHRPFGNSSFYLEDNTPYCERDWNILFTTKCYSCSYPIEAGDKWIEALERNYHSNCFKCTGCQVNLEGSTFYCKNGKPYCRLHAR